MITIANAEKQLASRIGEGNKDTRSSFMKNLFRSFSMK